MPHPDAWRAFPLMQLPLRDSSHEETCVVCRDIWWRSAMAYHEATHAAVALDLGLGVEFVAIDEAKEIEVTKLEASLYPLIKAGMKIPALATRLDERSLRTAPRAVLVSMVAPSCVVTGMPQVDEYAAIEATIGAERAKRLDLDPDEILDEAKLVVSKGVVQDRVLALATDLAKSGWVDLA